VRGTQLISGSRQNATKPGKIRRNGISPDNVLGRIREDESIKRARRGQVRGPKRKVGSSKGSKEGDLRGIYETNAGEELSPFFKRSTVRPSKEPCNGGTVLKGTGKKRPEKRKKTLKNWEKWRES